MASLLRQAAAGYDIAKPCARELGLKVVRDADGGPIPTGQAILRLVGYWISGAVFYLGYIWILVDKRRREVITPEGIAIPLTVASRGARVVIVQPDAGRAELLRPCAGLQAPIPSRPATIMTPTGLEPVMWLLS